MSRTMRVPRALRRVEDPHPGAWWLWALGVAAAASATTNVLLLAVAIAVVCLVVVSRRSDAPWALSFRLYLVLAAVVVAVRVVFRVIFGAAYVTPDQTVVLDLPQVPLPEWAAGISLLGPVTLESLHAGFADGLRLATILVCVGAANTLADPRRLLASLPAALYEVGAAVVIALSMFPQLAESVQRVRRARALRGDSGRGVSALRRILVPVLEDAFERSLHLAASMDARGYGRTGEQTAAARRRSGALLVLGLIGLCVGSYGWLDSSAPRVLAAPMLGVGLLLCAFGVTLAGRRVGRTRYRPDRWSAAAWAVGLSGVAAAAVLRVVAGDRFDVLYPMPGTVPVTTYAALLAMLLPLGALAATRRPRPTGSAPPGWQPAAVEEVRRDRVA